MKTPICVTISFGREPERRGMALPITLVILLVAGMLVGVSLYIVENLASVSRTKSRDELLLNASLAGLEHGKIWISDGSLPRRNANPAQSDLTDRIITPLLARRGTDVGIRQGEFDGVAYEVIVYDVNNVELAGLSYAEGAPPIPKEPPGGKGYMIEGMEASSTRYGVYLIRSFASFGSLEKVVEQFVLLEYD